MKIFIVISTRVTFNIQVQWSPKLTWLLFEIWSSCTDQGILFRRGLGTGVCVCVCHVWHRKCCINKTHRILTTCVHASVKSIFTRGITDNSKTNPIPAALICRRVRSWCSVPRKFSGWCKFSRHAYLWKFGSLNHGPNHTRTLVVMNPVHLVTILSWLASNVPLVGQNEALDVASWLKPMLFHLAGKTGVNMIGAISS